MSEAAVRRVIAAGADLFFLARIQAAGKAAGVEVESCAVAELPARCRARRPDLVILDLEAAGDPPGAARTLEDDPATVGIPKVGYYPHVDVALRDRAVAAGIEALPRSAFTARLPAILARG